MKNVPTAALLLPLSDIYVDAVSPRTYFERLTNGLRDEEAKLLGYIISNDVVRVLIRPEHTMALPENLAFLLSDTLICMGFNHYQLPDDKITGLAKDFCGHGVLLPHPGTSDSTKFVLRRCLPMFAVLEPTNNHYAPMLPSDWAEHVKIPS